MSFGMWRQGMVLGTLMALGCQHPSTADPADSQPEDEVWLTADQISKSSVKTAQPRMESLPQFITVGGKVAFDDLRVAHVISPVTGRISRTIALPGEHVKKGSPLLAIASPDVGSAVSDLVKAQADVNAALHDYNRQKALVAQSAGPERDLESAEDTYRKAKAEMDRAQKKAGLLQSGKIDSVTQA